MCHVLHYLHPPGEPRHDVGHGPARDELEAGEAVARQAVGQVVAHPVDLGEVNPPAAPLPEENAQCLSAGRLLFMSQALLSSDGRTDCKF